LRRVVPSHARRVLASARRWHPFRVLKSLLVSTVRICLRYRVTGLAAEAGFFALLSLPPLVLGLAGSAAWVGSELGADTEAQMRDGLRELVAPVLTQNVVDTVIMPTFTDAIATPRYDLISIGFVLSLWSGSRVLNVYIDTISIMYGLGGIRGIVRARALSFALYVLTLLLGALTIPLVLLGPTLLGRVLPEPLEPLNALYWPLVTVLGVFLLATLYHVATPVRASWRRDIPGAGLAFVIWLLASYVLRAVLSSSIGGGGSDGQSFSIYGPLTTPIVVLLWLYLLAVAVLIGAGLNASIERQWPARALARVAEDGGDDGQDDGGPGQDDEGQEEGRRERQEQASPVGAGAAPMVPVMHDETGVTPRDEEPEPAAHAAGKSGAGRRPKG